MAFDAQKLLSFFGKDSTGKLKAIPGSEFGASGIATYTVATLPAGVAGAVAFATNGRAFTGVVTAGNMVLEASGAGTGVLVTYNGSAWVIAGTNVTVTAT